MFRTARDRRTLRDTDPLAMMKLLLPFVVLLACADPASAQKPPAQPSSAALQSCLLGTPPEMWTKLKLTSDQLERMARVQEACKEECDAARAKKDPHSISTADGNEVMLEVKNVLTVDQYHAWVAYCAGSAPPAK